MSSASWLPTASSWKGKAAAYQDEEEDAGLLLENRSDWQKGHQSIASAGPKRSSQRAPKVVFWIVGAFAFLCAVGLIGSWMFGKDSHLPSREDGPTREQAYQRRLAQLHKELDVASLRDEFNLHGDIPDYTAYIARLRSTYDKYFTPTKTSSMVGDPWSHVEAHLDPLRTSDSKAIPHIVSSSAKNKSQIMPAFSSWAEKNKGWKVSLFDDEDASKFIASTFNELGIDQKQQGSFSNLLTKMPSNILRVDTFRYFRIFFSGGLYVDSDTSCRHAMADWPGLKGPHPKVAHGGDDVLRFLTSVARENLTIADDGAAPRWTPPSLVMGLEEDSFMAREDWRAMTFAKPLQITQWAFMAEPFHPVLLDALGTVMDRTVHELEKGTEGDYINKILEWTGPGMLTDAVWRYMGALYGATPRDFTFNQKAVRVGGMLMLPHMAFRAPDEPKDDLLRPIVHHHKHEWW
ncbi:hypothetical protein BDZ90DRAFT_169051 [Jaminaea rosea]|uniref:Glycosyltransferase family 32 protein n=1 Tax=Jaminaea rosea TaxID=1569628 RepID=A0A316UX19_9BASI|nr:hypothetical protein BDZ90DRAFT_169051 [Jaminaea rosea]PWN27665.1 hypothetical protein BDZ90DRAFT_169051 [Jaminaea rosea]